MSLHTFSKQYLISNLNQLQHGLELLNHDQYTHQITMLNNQSIGNHCRHIIEMIECLLEQGKTGLLNYNLRKRDVLLEQDLDFAKMKMNEFLTQILQLEDQPLKLQTESMITETIEYVNTSMFREIQYNAEHCTHHMAIIKMALFSEFPNITLPFEFGIAPSTLQYLRQTSS